MRPVWLHCSLTIDPHSIRRFVSFPDIEGVERSISVSPEFTVAGEKNNDLSWQGFVQVDLINHYEDCACVQLPSHTRDEESTDCVTVHQTLLADELPDDTGSIAIQLHEPSLARSDLDPLYYGRSAVPVAPTEYIEPVVEKYPCPWGSPIPYVAVVWVVLLVLVYLVSLLF